MEPLNERKIVQNAILIDTLETIEIKNSKLSTEESNNNNEGKIPSSKEILKKSETELQIKNEKKKNFFNKFTEKMKLSQSEGLKNKMLLYFLFTLPKFVFFSFIKEAQNDKFKTGEIKQKVSDFINDFEIEFQNLWRENSENEYENGEAIEGVITKALYSK